LFLLTKDNPEKRTGIASRGIQTVANALFDSAIGGNVTAMIFFLKIVIQKGGKTGGGRRYLGQVESLYRYCRLSLLIHPEADIRVVLR
jgi:hypothetical protein